MFSIRLYLHAMFMEFPVLAADIGGTNARFAIVEQDGTLTGLGTVANRDFPSVEDAVCHALKTHDGRPPKTAAIAMACPITGETFHLTNADWDLDPARFLEQTGLAELTVMNDFTAQGLAAVASSEEELVQLGGTGRDEAAPRIVIGPGTGLGVAMVLKAVGKWVIVPGEGGHVDLGPRTERETLLWPFLRKREGRMEAELAISGQGLENLHQAICRCDRMETPPLAAAEITQRALAGGDAACREAIELMVSLLARLVGDLAITTMARGGVYLTGGVTRHVLPVLKEPAFRTVFEDKHPFVHLMQQIPVYAMTGNAPALDGIAEFAADPGRFDIANAMRHFK